MISSANKTASIKETNLSEVDFNGELFYKISNVDELRPFFMSIVSDSDHWLFISSNGGITAGRKNAEYAFFPYYSDDKITESTEITGSKTILQIDKNGSRHIWEPFSQRSEGRYQSAQNLYMSRYGHSILFEEINIDLSISFQYQWCSSNRFGFVRKSRLVNHSSDQVQVALLDGLQNILPYGIPVDLQKNASNLADAYKRNELIPESGLGIFALSAIIVDKAEPSEALKANVAWSLGLNKPVYLLSSLQLKSFRTHGIVQQEEDIKGEKGAYFVHSEITLKPNEENNWMIIANVNQNHSAIVQLSQSIKTDAELYSKVISDISLGTENVIRLVAAADGLQSTADSLRDVRHFANVLFNIMRGGIFDHNYQIEKRDFTHYMFKANHLLFEEIQVQLQQLPDLFTVFELQRLVERSGNQHFIRLATEYLPLKFSRRHGDPSRPWNQFSINTTNEIDGSKILDYQGNWRDIFQNWEALAHSYPCFIEGMISKFLNASTFDGYNPYRVTKDGFDWETIEPDNPWSYIGYWGDHQIIYLLRFLEFAEQYESGAIEKLLTQNKYVYANVPYRIKSYTDIVKNPKDTIAFDHQNEKRIHERIKQLGADGALLTIARGEIYQVNFLEKILATVLSKLSNFVPEGGIWMNTQRPEWNDANNALVGNGVSMVTLYHLRRFLKFFQPILQKTAHQSIPVSAELLSFFNDLSKTFSTHEKVLSSSIDDIQRKIITDALGESGSTFRNKIYDHGFSDHKENLSSTTLSSFVNTALDFIEHSIKANKREDHLYHAYNLLRFENDQLKISHLSEMLEGQVAVLNSGFLSPDESLQLLEALRQSALYRKDQNSYILYPNKALPKFTEKNAVPASSVERSGLLSKLLHDHNRSIIDMDITGVYHFNGNFKNAGDVLHALNVLEATYPLLVAKEKSLILQIFEEVFNHKEFTGRSGTFYAYEGLGSIYWHMVSKLLLAVQETVLMAMDQHAHPDTIQRLISIYHAVHDGIGVHKSPKRYGAFPFTPYSHTPLHKGAQQPGMTGQVKEDILARIGELGVKMKQGKLRFEPRMLHRSAFLQKEAKAGFILADGQLKHMVLAPDSLAFTVCQVPVIYKIATSEKTEVYYCNGALEAFPDAELNDDVSSLLFRRTGEIDHVIVSINENHLR